jgi:DNA-binding response OmpR family regulator
MVLTARTGLDDKVTGLDKGADDYLAKPFDLKELTARLRVFERRLATATTSIISLGYVELDTQAHSVNIQGELVDMYRREFMPLKALLESAGKVLTRDSLATRLYSWGEALSSNAIEVHIHNLRKRLPDKFITTVRGIGYTIHKP